MAAANEKQILSYMEQQKEAHPKNSALSFGQDVIAQALGVSVELVEAALTNLKESGKVHTTSPGTWTLGRGW